MAVTIPKLEQLYGYPTKTNIDARGWAVQMATLQENLVFESVKATWRMMSRDTDQVIVHRPVMLWSWYSWTSANSGEDPPSPAATVPTGFDSFGVTHTPFDDVSTEDGTALAGYGGMELAQPRTIPPNRTWALWLVGNANIGPAEDYRYWDITMFYTVYYRIPAS